MSTNTNTHDRRTDTGPEAPSSGWVEVYAELGVETTIEPTSPAVDRDEQPAARALKFSRVTLYILPWTSTPSARVGYIDPHTPEHRAEPVDVSRTVIDELEKASLRSQQVDLVDTPAWTDSRHREEQLQTTTEPRAHDTNSPHTQ